jgi:hemerythrin-like domain-containing protein
MKPTEELKADHRTIERMLAVLYGMSERLEASKEVPAQDLAGAVEFIQIFADRFHHGKEEDLLFPALEEAGFPRDSGPIGVMLGEHEIGRQFVRALAQAVAKYRKEEKAAVPDIVENARGYAALLAQHIFKEDNILFPMAEAQLSMEKQEELEKAFAKVGEEHVGRGKREELLGLLDRLEKLYREKAQAK